MPDGGRQRASRWLPRAALCAACLLASGLPVHAAAPPEVHWHGVDAATQAAIAGAIGSPQGEGEAATARWLREAGERLQQAMIARGFSSAAVALALDPSGLQVRIDPGPPTLITAVEVQIEGPAPSDPPLADLAAARAPRRGEQLNHGAYEQFKSDLLALALTRGYFDAHFDTHRLAISRREASAEIALRLRTGPRYRFGAVQFDTDILDPALLAAWVPFGSGEPYDAIALDQFGRDLRASGYFDRVVLAPLIERAVDGQVPIAAELSPRSPSSATVGIGYSTDTGARLSARYDRHYINRRGHSAGSTLSLAEAEQSIALHYQIPHRPDPAAHYLQLDAGVQQRALADNRYRQFALGASHREPVRWDWVQTTSLRYTRDESRTDGRRTQTALLIPGLSFSRDFTGELPFRGREAQLQLSLALARQPLLSELDFDRLQLRARHAAALADRHWFHSRFEWGWLRSPRPDQVPLSQRFFAGGDNSIRGFANDAVGPVDSDGDPVGGHRSAVASLEYEYRWRANWGLAAFVDVGRVGRGPAAPLARGAGLGLRWRSPIGPVRIYLGWPLSEEVRKRRLHFSVGG